MIRVHVSPIPTLPASVASAVVAQGGLVPRGGRENVFQEIYWVFLVLGTLVGVVVIGYMLYNAYAYREREDYGPKEDVERPQLGELPEGGGGGRKLALSLFLSAVIVISLIGWTYFSLQYVESADASSAAEEELDVDIEGYQFGWEFEYPNGNTSTEVLRVPNGTQINIAATSRDVWHNFGIPAFDFKTDAIPGETTRTWFMPDEPGTYRAQCYELCGVGHSAMNANVTVMEQSAFERWYANTTPANGSSGTTNATATTTGGNTSA